MNSRLLPVLKGILEQFKESMDNGKLLYLLITAPANAKEVRSALLAHLKKLSRKQFQEAAAKLSVTVRDNSDLEALLAHFKLKELPPPAVPVRLPTFEKYELTPEREQLINELCGENAGTTIDEAPDFSVHKTQVYRNGIPLAVIGSSHHGEKTGLYYLSVEKQCGQYCVSQWFQNLDQNEASRVYRVFSRKSNFSSNNVADCFREFERHLYEKSEQTFDQVVALSEFRAPMPANPTKFVFVLDYQREI